MPDIVTHHAMGEKVLQSLCTEISSIIDNDIFRSALMGPDSYLNYRFFAGPFRHGVNKRAQIMHTTQTGPFLMELAKHSQSEEMFSFLAGFLCHYALDSISHPFICEMAKGHADMHTAIEHRLDVLELKRQGKQYKDIKQLFVKYPKLPEFHDAIQNVYGWDDDCYSDGVKHMHLFYRIVKDQHGFFDFFTRYLPGKLSTLSYRTKKADALNLDAYAVLEKKAVERARLLITAAYRFRKHEIDEEELSEIVGNCSYLNG